MNSYKKKLKLNYKLLKRKNAYKVLIASIKAAGLLGSMMIFSVFLIVPKITGAGMKHYVKGYCKFLAKFIFMAKVKVDGKISPRRPLMIVANHSSYLDIVAIGKIVPAAFVAKSEVKKWPILGFLAAASGTLFINRSRTKVKAQTEELKEIIFEEASPIIVFPEGTSNNGSEVKPFKTAMFSMVEEQMGKVMSEDAKKHIIIQPLTIAYTSANGKKIKSQEIRDKYAWYLHPVLGDMELLPHIWEVLKRGEFEVKITLHEPLETANFSDRKELAKNCEEIIAKELKSLISY